VKGNGRDIIKITGWTEENREMDYVRFEVLVAETVKSTVLKLSDY
jgi:hypothetical protein